MEVICMIIITTGAYFLIRSQIGIPDDKAGLLMAIIVVACWMGNFVGDRKGFQRAKTQIFAKLPVVINQEIEKRKRG